MIVLRRKQFAFGLNNIGRAISGLAKDGTKLTGAQRTAMGIKGASQLGLSGLAIGGATIGTAKAIGATKDAVTGNMGEDNGAGY